MPPISHDEYRQWKESRRKYQEANRSAAIEAGCKPEDCGMGGGDPSWPCYHCGCPDRRHENIMDKGTPSEDWSGLKDSLKGGKL